jgi:hypothetical protein
MFIHFSDLKKDMSSEIRKIATFLAIQINEETWTPIASWRGRNCGICTGILCRRFH